MTASNTNWRVPLWAMPYLFAALAAESLSNALKAYGLGQHLEQFTFSAFGHDVSAAGAAFVVAAIAISGSQAKAAWVALTPTSPARQRIVCGLAAALLLGVSGTAMVSHLLEAQRAKASDETGDRGKHDRAQTDYDKAAGELATLKDQRSTEEVTAAMDRAPVSRAVFARTKECREVTRQDSFEACKPILDLRQENGRALRKRELEQSLPALRAALDATPRPAEASAAETSAAGVWGWLMGFAVVFVATFGSVIFARVDQLATVAAPPSARDSAQTSFDPAAIVCITHNSNHPEIPDSSASRLPRPDGRRRGGSAPNRPRNQGPNGSAGRRFPRNEVLANLQRQLANGERFDSQDRMSERFGVPKSTLSEWLADWESSGAIPARRTVGRCKALAGE